MARSRNASSTSSTDFRKDLGRDITVQDYDTASAYNRRASEASAESIMLGVKAKIGAFEKLFSTGVDAGIGYLKNQEAKEILAELDKLEGFGKSALKNQKELDDLTSGTGQYATIQQGIENAREKAGPAPTGQAPAFAGAATKRHEAATTAAIQEVTSAVEREKARLMQGIQSQSQTITNIAAITKKYSAMVPGMADEFRKVAASKTGISNIDVLGVYTALTKTDTAATQAAQVQMAYDKALVEFWGKPLEQITGEERNRYAALKAAEAQAAQMSKAAEIEDMTQAQANNVTMAAFQSQLALSKANLQIKALKIIEANAKSTGKGALDFTMTQAAYSKALMDENLRMQDVVASMRSKGLINEKQEEHFGKLLKNQIDAQEKWFANQENFNMWERLNEVLAGDAAAQQSALSLNSPMMVWLGEIGLAPDVAHAFWAAYQGNNTNPGAKEGFIRNYSETLWNELERMATTDDQRVAAIYRRYLRDPSLSADTVIKADPEAGRTTVALVQAESMARLAKMNDPAYKVHGSEWKIATAVLKNFSSNATTPVSDPKSWTQLQAIMDNGSLFKALAIMPSEHKEIFFRDAITPFGQRLQYLYTSALDDAHKKLTAQGVALVFDGSKWVVNVPNSISEYMTSGQKWETYTTQLNKLNRLQTSFFKNVPELADGYIDSAALSKQYAKNAAESYTNVGKQLQVQEQVIQAEMDALKIPDGGTMDPEAYSIAQSEYQIKRSELKQKLEANREAQKQMERSAQVAQASAFPAAEPGEPARDPGRTSFGIVREAPVEGTELKPDEMTATPEDGTNYTPVKLPADAHPDMKEAWDTLHEIDFTAPMSSVSEVRAVEDKLDALHSKVSRTPGLAGYDELSKEITRLKGILVNKRAKLFEQGRIESYGERN